MIKADLDSVHVTLFKLEPMTPKQEKYLTYLVSSLVDYGRKLYLQGNKLGLLVPVLIPKDYPFTVQFNDFISKGEAVEIIGHIKHQRFDDLCDLTADKVYLDGHNITLADFLRGKRIIV